MIYSLFRIKKNLLSKFYIYLLILVQISISISIFIFSLNNYFFEKNNYDDFLEKITSTTTMIESNPINGGPYKKDAISYDDYLYLKENFSDTLTFQYSNIGNINFMHRRLSDPEKIDIISMSIVFMDTDEMTELFGFIPEKETYYAGGMVIENLETLSNLTLQERDGSDIKNNFYFNLNDSGNITINDKCLVINENEYSLTQLPSHIDEKSLLFFSSDSFQKENLLSLANCIFLPLDEIHLKEDIWITDQTHFYTRLLVKELYPTSQHLYNMLVYLEDLSQGSHTYKVGDQHLEAKMVLEYSLATVIQLLLVAIIELVLISISNAGILYISFLKRKKDISISLMLGSTFKQQVFELIGEIFSVVLTGVILGICIYYTYISYNQISLDMHINTVFIIISILFGVTITSSSLALGNMRKLSPIAVLQNL